MRYLLLLPLIASGAALSGCQNSDESPVAAAESEPSAIQRNYDPQQITQTVAFWEGQVKRDPQGALGMSQLAGAYLQRQRETGDDSYAERAEATTRRALELLPGRPDTILRLGRSLLAQHRFTEALACADKVVKYEPQAHRLRADALVELGRYAEAERAVALVPPNEADAGSWALRANMAGLRGQQESALKYWDKAVTLATRHPDLSPETVAWFHVKRGNARAMWNLPDQAEQDFTEALKIFPRDFRALESLANLSLSRQDWKSAEEWSEKLIKLAPDPDIHAMLGEAYQKTGKTQQAQAQFALADSKARLALKDAGTHSRHLVLYCADANRHLPQALRLALTDSKRRGDIYTWDTLAWALYKNRRLDEAKAASSKALALGTRDSMLWFHAGMIDAARGDRAGAKQKLTRALEINPQFHSEFPQQARATLKTL